MTQDWLTQMIDEANPVGDERIASFDFDAADRELIAELLAADAPATAPRDHRPRRRPGRRLALALGALGLATAAALLVIGTPFGDDGSGGSTAYAADAIKIAESNRRLLVTEQGWDVYYASFQSPDYGEVGFEDARGIYHGGEFLDMSWYGDEREIAQRSKPSGEPVTIAGEQGYFYEDHPGNFVAVLPGKQVDNNPGRPGSHLELGETGTLIDGVAKSPAAFRSRLESIISVDVDTWLAAMPASVVQPVGQRSEIDRLLEGVPLPPGFDRAEIAPTGLPEDRYQLTAYVLRGAYCGWLDEWWFAQKGDDDARAEAAIDVLLEAENWPAVKDQAATGSLDQDFRQYAKTVADGYGDKDVYDQMENCIEY